MAHVVEAEIEGLAGRTKPVKIKFDRHLNMVYGLNGSGKTSFLKILHSAMTGVATSLQSVPFTHARVRIHSLMDGKEYTRTVTKAVIRAVVRAEGREESIFDHSTQVGLFDGEEDDTVDEGSPAGWSETPKRQKHDSLTKWQHRYLPTTRLHLGGGLLLSHSRRRAERGLTEEQLDEYFAAAMMELWSSYSTEVLGAVRSAQETGLANILKAVLAGTPSRSRSHSNTNVENAYQNTRKFLERQGSQQVLGTLEEFSERYKADESLQRVVDDIFKVEQEIDEAMAPRRELERLIQSLYSGNKRIEFTDRAIKVQAASGEEIGLMSLSSGEKHLIRLLLESLLAEKSSILIDEPEISLHVDWQRDLMKICRTLNPECQFIVATHSPEILADIRDERIVAL